MKRPLLQILICLILVNVIFNQSKTAEDSKSKAKSNAKESSKKIKELDISEDFNTEVYYRLGKIKHF